MKVVNIMNFARSYEPRDLEAEKMLCETTKQQLDLVSDIMDVLKSDSDYVVDGMDARNYGELSGLPCAKKYWADVLGCKPEQTFVGGASSLTLMYDMISRAYTHGLLHSPRAWCKEEVIKFLCPSPGYDRHFKITQSFGFELITIPMTDEGPDMDMVEQYVKDPAVKGIWCVPKYSNPDGIIYSEKTIARIAALKAAAPDFTVMWDNAYCVHHLYEEEELQDHLPEMLSMCKAYDNEDWKNYIILVHGIKSAMMSIGAVKLSEMAKGLEFAGKADDYEYIRERHTSMTEEYARIMKILEECTYLEPKVTEEVAVEKESISREEFEKLLIDLENATYEFDGTKMLPILDKLSAFSYHNLDLAKELKPVYKKIEMFDFMSAYETVVKIKEKE